MPNIASALKAEIARIARKEVRSEIESLKKAVTQQKGQLAALRKRTDAAERELKRAVRAAVKQRPAVVEEEHGSNLRFSAKGLKSKRQSLGLSAEQMGVLLGTTGQSVYKWEDGRARPRTAYLPAIAAVRKMGKREAQANLESLRGSA